MEIKSITSSHYFSKEVSVNKKNNVEKDQKPKDKLEISEEAKKMNEESSVKDMEKIRQRITDKFYDSEHVIRKVAGAVLKQIEQETK